MGSPRTSHATNLPCCSQSTNVARFRPASADVACLSEVNTFLAHGAAHTRALAVRRHTPNASPGELSAPASASPASPQRRRRRAAAAVSPINLPSYRGESGSRSKSEASSSLASAAVVSDADADAPDLSDLCHNQVYRLAGPGRAPRHELELLLVPAKPSPEGLRLYGLYQARVHGLRAVGKAQKMVGVGVQQG